MLPMGLENAFQQGTFLLFLAPESGNRLIDGTPIRKATEVPVVDVQVGHYLPSLRLLEHESFRIDAVDGIEDEAALLAEIYGCLKQFSFPGGPQDDLVAVILQTLQGFDGEGFLLAYFRILVLDDGSVEIHSDSHRQSFFSP